MKSRFLSVTLAVATAAMIGLGGNSANAGGHHLGNQCDDCGRHGCGIRGCGIHGCGAHCALHGTGIHGCGAHHACRNGYGGEWAGNYYHTMWGQPVALVVPPTAELQTHWNWGVAQTRVTPIWPQYSRAFPGPYAGGRGFLPTPRWPSSTDQFGVYYVRGPW